MLHIILIISIISQDRVDLGITNHVWQKKRAAIAATIVAVVDVQIGKFSSMSTHPNAVSEFWDKKCIYKKSK